MGTEARGQEAAEEEEEEAAGLVTPRAGPTSWYWLGSQYQLWGCLGSPPAPHPHPRGSCSPSAGTDPGFLRWIQPYTPLIPHPRGSPQPTADARHSLRPTWQRDKGRLCWSSRAHVPPGSWRGQRGHRRGKAGQEEEEEGRQPWGATGGQASAPAQHGEGERGGPDPSAEVVFAIDPCCTQAH